MPMIPVQGWTPDTADYGKTGSLKALNVIPASGSYRPFPAFATFSSNALTARAQGAFFARNPDGSGAIFSGGATKLYLLTNAAWADVSRVSGGAYACPADARWTFIQFGNDVLAWNGFDAPQVYTLGSSSNFAALAGSPPTARYACVAGDFVMTGQTATNRQKLQWSAINADNDYAASVTTQSDSQTLPDGGWIQGLVGLERSVIIPQEFCVRRGDYVGPPTIWNFSKIADNVGATVDGSIAAYGDRIFFLDRSGFQMVVGGAQVIPIGKQRVDRYFWSDATNGADQTNLQRVTAAVDPVNSLYLISYPLSGNSGTPNHMLAYHWDLDQWSEVSPGDHEMVWSGATQSGFTLEGLDSISTSLDALPYSLDSAVWTGVARRLAGGFGTDHKLGFFNGANLAAIVDTMEGELTPGLLTLVRAARPMVSGGTPSLALGTRNRQIDARAYSTAVAIDSIGKCDFRSVNQHRYTTGRITMAAGDIWDHIMGIDVIEAAGRGKR